MPGEESWLFLKISEKDPKRNQKKDLFISVPKKIVPLATRRNRLRRLIREAVRHDPFFLESGALFEFKVTSFSKEPDLSEVKAALKKLKTESSRRSS